MGKISIQELASILVDRKGLNKKDASAFISAAFEIIQQRLESDKIVKVKGLGTFKIIDVDDRESVNVNTGKRVLIEGHGKITFTPDSLMKELVNKPFSQFETVVLNEGVDFEDTEKETAPEPPVDPHADPSTLDLVDFGLGRVAADLSNFPVIEDKRRNLAYGQWPPKPQAAPVSPQPESATEASPQPESAPVVSPQPESATIVSPQPESVPLAPSQPESVPLAPSQPESTPIASPVQKNDEPPVEPQKEDTHDAAEREPEVITDDEGTQEKRNGWLPILLAGFVGVLIGYLAGNYLPLSGVSQLFAEKEPVSQQVVTPVQKSKRAVVKPEPKTAASAQTDTIKPETAKPEATKPEVTKPEAAKPVATKPVAEKPAAANPQAVTPAATTDIHSKYAAMDARVRLGAYRIVGTDKVIKAKEGQTLAGISRALFGPGMECYLEVYNNLKASSQLKVGQEIKVPKLEFKKKKKP